MARKTAAELAEARKVAAEARKVATAQRMEAARLKAEAEAEAERLADEYEAQLRANRAKFRQLESAADGMYDEIEKLNRKWPTMNVTQHMVARTNKLLGEIRDLIKDEHDLFIDGLADIVAAGDPPETRDVVLILREAKDALTRYEAKHKGEWAEVSEEDDEEDEDY
jgi:hypothetical protein